MIKQMPYLCNLGDVILYQLLNKIGFGFCLVFVHLKRLYHLIFL